jgi:4-hydroxyphenylpyruvate dioxygenase
MAVESTSNGTSRTDNFSGFAYVHWYVGNAKQAAAYYVARMGFHKVAFKGLETGSRSMASHVVRNGEATFVFTSPLRDSRSTLEGELDAGKAALEEMHLHQQTHGDAVKGW